MSEETEQPLELNLKSELPHWFPAQLIKVCWHEYP